jgi:hypothetical protein
MAIDVKEEQDGSFTISWDENDPTESILNTWTNQDFIDCRTLEQPAHKTSQGA